MFHQIEHRFALPVAYFKDQQTALAKSGKCLRNDNPVRLKPVFTAIEREIGVVHPNLQPELANFRGRDIGRVTDDHVERAAANSTYPIST